MGQGNKKSLWIEDDGYIPEKITETTRIGIDYAGEDALKPWRFYITDSIYVSKKVEVNKKEAQK